MSHLKCSQVSVSVCQARSLTASRAEAFKWQPNLVESALPRHVVDLSGIGQQLAERLRGRWMTESWSDRRLQNVEEEQQNAKVEKIRHGITLSCEAREMNHAAGRRNSSCSLDSSALSA